MAWIESHTVTLRHRKLRSGAAELRVKPVHLLGHLHALWHTALEQQEDGDLSAWSDELISDAAAFTGDQTKFVSMLLNTRWLGYFDESGHVIPGTERLIHDWIDYAGKYLITKYSTSNREKLIAIWDRHQKKYGRESKATNQREDSDQKATTPNPPTHPTHPTQPNPPTNPPNPPGRGGIGAGRDEGVKGSGSGGSGSTVPARPPANGNLGGAMVGQLGEFERMGLVQGLLNSVNVNPDVVQELMFREDLSPKLVQRHIDALKQDPKVKDVAAALVGRLRSHNRTRVKS